jgi:tetratricopeptide (TPR) repeat protein
LDAEQKCAEAEAIYQPALARGTPSLALLNNLGNHYLACGDAEKARSSFERVLKLNPRHANANLQLGRIAVERREGARALAFLAQVPDSQPATRLLRAEALHWAGQIGQALALLDGLRAEIAGDQRLFFLYALTCARIGTYSQAEEAFQALLAQHPEDFEILLNLGRVAALAGHFDRARRALEVALRLHPNSVDCLVELGQLSALEADPAKAVYLLAKARELAPQQPGIALALAHAATAGEYYGDAALAYDAYLRLRPDDDTARRDRALVCGYTDARRAEGLQDLATYVKTHPADPVGYFDQAQLLWREHPEEALDQLTKAVNLDPALAGARVARAWLLNRLGRTAEALPELEQAVKSDPRDARALDQLGTTYAALDRSDAAESPLRRALSLAPDNPDVLLHLGKVLMELGREPEATPLLHRYQQLRPQRVRSAWKQPGMIEAATLPAAERAKRQIERLSREAKAHPDDPTLQLHLASLLLSEGRSEEASREFSVLLSRNASTAIWNEAGNLLLSFEQYGLAREFLLRAAAGNAASYLDLAIAVFFIEGAEKALLVLHKVPEEQRSGDFILLKAKLLDAEGHPEEAEKVLDRGLDLSLNRPRILQEAALLLVRHDREPAAMQLLDRAPGEDPELLLLRAVVLALMNQNAAAEMALKAIEAKWPEWERPYLVHGLLLERAHSPDAAKKLRTAMALDPAGIASRCALARVVGKPAKDGECACAGGLRELLLPPCRRP